MSESEKKPFFSGTQTRVVAAGVTVLALVCLLGAMYGIFSLLQRFVSVFSDVLMPLAIAGVLAMLLRPITTFLEVRLKLSRAKAIVMLYALMLMALGGMFALLLPTLSRQVIDLAEFVPKLVADSRDYFQERFPELLDMVRTQLGEEKFNAYMEQLSGSLKAMLASAFGNLGSAGQKVLSLFGKMAAYAVVPVYLFYLLDSKRSYTTDLDKQLSFIRKEWREDILFLVRQFVDILVSFFRGQIVIGLILAVILATGFSLVGLKFGLILGGVIGLLNIVPYLGTIIGVVVVLPIAWLQPGGGPVLVGLCVAVFVISQLIGDYVLTPRIMGNQTGMSPMLIIFSIFFWGTALKGILGMILAIPLTAFFLVFWRLARRKYLLDADPVVIQSGQTS
jgi:predicted PurR-regulated permease PerM